MTSLSAGLLTCGPLLLSCLPRSFLIQWFLLDFARRLQLRGQFRNRPLFLLHRIPLDPFQAPILSYQLPKKDVFSKFILFVNQLIDFVARDGEVTGLIGPNGAGKTTALRIIYTVMKPNEGSVRVDGYDVTKDRLQVQ